MAEFKGIFGIIYSSLPLVGKYSYLLNLYMYFFISCSNWFATAANLAAFYKKIT